GRVAQRPSAGTHTSHIDGDDLRSSDALSKAFKIARAASSVGEDDKRITRSVNGAFEARRANIYDLSLCQPEPPYLLLPRCIFPPGYSEGVVALLAGTGLHPLMTLQGRPRSIV